MKKTTSRKKAKPKKAKKADPASRLAALLNDFGNPPDVDVWMDHFFFALRERIGELDSAEDTVLQFFAVELYERDMDNGGLAQALINYGYEGQLAEWCVQGYKLVGKPAAAAAMQKALKLAKKEAATLGKITGKRGTDEGIELYTALRKHDPFKALERELGKHVRPNPERRAFIEKHRKDFLQITAS